MGKLRQWLTRYLNENFDDLLRLDLKMARILGAPAPHTLSSYSWLLESKGKPWGRFWRPIIDKLFQWLLNQENHCLKDFNRVVNGGL